MSIESPRASGNPTPVRRLCGANLRKKPGKTCGQLALSGKGRCKLHGGARGSGRPIEHGRYSKVLRGVLGERYRESLANPKLMSLREPVAMQDALVQRCADRLAELDTPHFRERALELFRLMSKPDEDGGGFAARALLGEWLEQGAAEDRALRDLADENGRLHEQVVEVWKIRLHKAQVVNAQDVRGLFAWFFDMVMRTLAEHPDLRQQQIREIEARFLPAARPAVAGDDA